jgi:hypothetical protein
MLLVPDDMTLLRGKREEAAAISAQTDADLVTFELPFDDEIPKDWPSCRKWTVTGVLSATSFYRIMISTIMAPALSTIGSELKMTSLESVMAMSVYVLATAFRPLLIGPLSEIYSRSPILHATNIWFLAWNILRGFARNEGTIIAARFSYWTWCQRGICSRRRSPGRHVASRATWTVFESLCTHLPS